MRIDKRNTSGYTLTELMIVVFTVGLLASIAGPMCLRYFKKGQNGALVANLRAASDAFVMYSFENHQYPESAGVGVIPAGMETYLYRLRWTEETPVGGSWNWDKEVNGYKAGVAIVDTRADIVQMSEVDASIDDGNLGTGRFRIRPNGYVFVVEE